MVTREEILTDQNHVDLNSFLKRMLDAYKDGKVSRLTAVSRIAHVVAAIDKGTKVEITSWLENHDDLFTEDENKLAMHNSLDNT